MDAPEINKKVKERLAKLGNYKLTKVKGEIDLPDDITKLNIDDLSALWYKIIASKAFIDQELGKAETSVIIRKGLRPPRSQRSEKEVAAEAYVARLKGISDSLETLITGLNRSITIRLKEFNDEERENKRTARRGFRK